MVRKRPAFDRIQVDVLVRIATAAARMVGIGATRLGGMVKNEPTLNVGSGVLVSVFVGQHDRQHTRDDGFSICALDIRLLIQVDLEKDRVAFGLKEHREAEHSQPTSDVELASIERSLLTAEGRLEQLRDHIAVLSKFEEAASAHRTGPINQSSQKEHQL